MVQIINPNDSIIKIRGASHLNVFFKIVNVNHADELFIYDYLYVILFLEYNYSAKILERITMITYIQEHEQHYVHFEELPLTLQCVFYQTI